MKTQDHASITLTKRDGSAVTYDMQENSSFAVVIVTPDEEEKGANVKRHVSANLQGLDVIIDSLQEKMEEQLEKQLPPELAGLMNMLKDVMGK